MMLLAPHLTAFLADHLPRDRGASENTRDAYAYTFILLLNFAAQRLNTIPSALRLDQIDVPLVLAFLDHLTVERGCVARSRNARLAAIKSFARFLEYRVPMCLEQCRRLRAIPSRKTNEALVTFLTREEMHALLDAPDPNTRRGVRDRAMLYLAYAGGLRASELVGLCLNDLSLQGSPSVRVCGKGRRERVLPLWKQTAKALRAWLSVRETSDHLEVFLNARGEPLTRAGFAYMLKTYVRTASSKHPSLSKKRISPHVLRHTCAMHTLEATGDIRKVALWLGHANLQTTEVYLRADPSEKLEIIHGVVTPALRTGHFRAPDQLLASLRAVPRRLRYEK